MRSHFLRKLLQLWRPVFLQIEKQKLASVGGWCWSLDVMQWSLILKCWYNPLVPGRCQCLWKKVGLFFSQNSCRDWNLTHDIGTKISTHLASHPATLGLMLSVPKNFSLMLLRFIDGTAQNSWQRLDYVNQTHLVLASGKLVLQKFLSS